MSRAQPRYSPEETARRGDALYEQQVRAKVEQGNQDKIVAIDIQTGSYAVGNTARDASNRLFAHHPDAEIWFVRIGHRTLHRIGARPGSKTR